MQTFRQFPWRLLIVECNVNRFHGWEQFLVHPSQQIYLDIHRNDVKEPSRSRYVAVLSATLMNWSETMIATRLG